MKTLHTTYNNFAKRFAVVLTILMTISINNVWAAETTTEYVFKSTASVSNNQITTDGVTWSITSEKGKGSPSMDCETYNTLSALRIGSGGSNYYSKVTLSTSAFSSYRVSKVVVSICSNNGGSKTITAKQGDITIGSTKQSFNSTTWVDITLNSNQGNGGNLSIDISNDATAIYIHSIKVTYSESYNVDWIIEPNEGGTLSPTSGTSTTVELNSGYTYSDNVYTIISGAAEVSQAGDVFTAIPTTNTTIQINVMKIVPYTVNWYVDGNIIHTQTDNLGEILTEIPNLDDYDECNGKVFVGWITTPTYSPLQDIITNTTGMSIPYGGANYYALFAEPINNGVFVERATGTFKLYAIVNGNNYYAGTGIDDRKLTSTTAIANAGDYTITHISNDQYTIQYGNQYISHVNGKVDLAYLEYNEENKSKCHWTITRTGTNGTWRVASPVNNDRALVFTTANNNSNVFKAYATSNITADGAYYDLEIGNGEAISYQNYTTTCTTDVTVTLDPNGGRGNFEGWDYVDGNYTKTVEKDQSVTLPKLEDQIAYTFDGWYDENDTKIADGGADYTPEADITLYAQWTPKSLTNYRTLCDYEITWLIGGDSYTEGNPTTTVQAGKTITTLPTNPTDNALGCCADKFMGWTASPAQTIDKADVFTTLAEAQTKFPNITSNKTFFAVFATAAAGVGTSVVDFSEVGYVNATRVTEPIILGDGEGHGDATITLAKAQSSKNDAKYYDDGEAVRVYAGSTITISSTYNDATIKSVTFEFSTSDTEGDNIISVTGGDGTYSEGTWTGDATAVTFTIGGSTGHRRIASITVTTGVSGSQYTNYVTNCTLSGEARLGEGTIQYANEGTAIAVNCGRLSSKNSAATLTFPDAQYLTCPITLTASNGFVLSTNKSGDAYAQTIKVTPYKQGSSNPGKLRTIYIRANAEGKTENFNGTITIAGGEIATTTINVSANVNCAGYTFTLTDHLGNIIGGTPISHYEGDIIEEEPDAPTPDDCSTKYTFDGWSQTSVVYGSLVYNKVTFPFTMPAADVTLIPVYRVNTTEDYHRVTSDLGADNWAGDYLIAAEKDGVYHFANGAVEHIGVADSKQELTVNDNIVSATEGDQYFVKLIAVDYGYVLQSKSGKYNYIRNNEESGLNGAVSLSTAIEYPLTVTFNQMTGTISIANTMTSNDAALQYTKDSKCFRFYKPGNQTPIYLYKKSPLYTSYLACGTIDVTGNEVYVTATQNRGVMAPEVLTVTAEGMYPNANVILTSNSSDVYFSIDRTANFEKVDLNKPKTSLPLNADADGKLQQDIYVHYKPGTTGNGVPADVVVTAKSDNLPISDNQTIHVRNLPAQFVIATKVGSHWYALPADMSAATNPEGVLIKVDETEMRAEAPTSTVYTLWPVKTTATENDRYTNATGEAYGDRVRFGAVNYGQRGLWANNNKDDNTIRNYAVIDALGADGLDGYEWKLTTTVVDGHWQYTLQTDQTQNQNYLRYWPAATGGPKWGTYASGNGNNQLYFLPINATYTEMDLEVMEWGTNSMVWRIEQNAPTKVNIQYNTLTYGGLPVSPIENSDLYSVVYSLDGKDCGIMTIIDIVSGARKIIRIPILINEEKLGSEYTTSLGRDVCADCDIVILNGGKLTADEAKSTGSHVDFANIYVYPGGKLVLDEKSLGVKQQVYLRGGYSWLNQSTYALPEVYLNGDINFNGSNNIIYDYYIQNYKYYQFALPYDVQLANVTDEAGIDNFPVWVKHYNGALRAADPHATSWEWYPSETGDANAYFKAGEGYIIAAQPRPVGNTANRPLSIIRFPLSNKVFNTKNGLESDLSITTTAHGIGGYKAGTVTANNVGWNFLGNPFLSTWQGDIGYKQLTKHPNEANWDGTYDWVDANIKYITIMSAESGSDYAQYIASETELKPFFPFYLQETADGGSGTIDFAAANRVKKAPAVWNVGQEEREAYVQLEIATDAVADQTGVFVGNKYSDDLDFDDYEKMFGTSTELPKLWLLHEDKRMAFEAMTESTAATYIPLGYRAPKIGKYIFAINEEASKVSEVEAVYLTDNQTGVTDFDLSSSAYEFESNGELYNDSRFTIRIVLRDESSSTVTGVENVLHFNSDHPYKFIYQDKMYILRNGVIYDAMGKQVQTINK